MGLALGSLAAADLGADDVAGAVIKILIGVALCFFGTRSMRFTGLCLGFALGASLAEALGASVGIALLVGLGGAIAGLLAVNLVVRWTLFAIGALAGATVAASMYRHLIPGEGNVVLIVVVVAAVGLICGFIADRFRDPMLAAVTALGGASMILSGAAALAPDALGFLADSETPAQGVLAIVALLALAGAGWAYQRRWRLSKAASR